MPRFVTREVSRAVTVSKTKGTDSLTSSTGAYYISINLEPEQSSSLPPRPVRFAHDPFHRLASQQGNLYRSSSIPWGHHYERGFS